MLKSLAFITGCILFVFLIACQNPLEERVNDLEKELDAQEQLINSLIAQIYSQQTLIDSLNKSNREHTDSLYSELEILVANQNETIQLLISSLPSTGENFIRIDSLQICWGSGYANDIGVTIQFPVAFIEPPKVFITYPAKQDLSGVTNITATNAKFYTYAPSWGYVISYCAMGKWQ
jgi:uncharacterized coiled-coil protein SlyX